MATLGKPAIPTPGALDLRAVQQTTDNIRERFAGLEAAVVLAGKTSTASQAAASSDVSRLISSLRADLAALAAVVASTDDGALLLMSDNSPPQAASGEQLLWPTFDPPPVNIGERLLWPTGDVQAADCSDANQILAARVFGA